jgi:DNA adenine methylase
MNPVLKYPGAKWRIAEWIIGHLPAHTSYLEPFFGSGAVYFSKPIASIEAINDLDCNVVNLFRVLREHPERLADLCALTPWAQDEYADVVQKIRKPIDWQTAHLEMRLERARQFITASWQMFGSKNVTSRNGWRHRYLGGQSPCTTWTKLPDRIMWAAERLQQTQICNQDALKLIQAHNGREILIYADPPYLGDTRSHGKLYDHEMKSAKQHMALLDVLEAHTGMVVLSGYDSGLYQARLGHWTRFYTVARAQSNRQTMEVIWLNPMAAKRLGKPTQQQMFELSEPKGDRDTRFCLT